MNRFHRVLILLGVSLFLASAAWGNDKCANKESVVFAPAPSAYQQISAEEAKASKNYIPADQHSAGVAPETSSGQSVVQEQAE